MSAALVAPGPTAWRAAADDTAPDLSSSQTANRSTAAVPALPPDSRHAATTNDALTIAAHYGHSVTVDDATTETSLTTAQSNGALQVEQHSVPQRVKQADGSWLAVDETLAQQADGSWAPAVTPHPVAFTSGATSEAPMATVTTPSGARVTIGDAGLALGTPLISGATATYADVLPGIDLHLTATPGGMSQVLQVNTAQAAADPALARLSFDIGGAALSAIGGQAATAMAADGSAVVTAAPTWWDASDGGTAAGPGGPDIPVPLPDSVNGNAFTIDAAAAASSRPNAAFPLFIDPDVTPFEDGRAYTDNAYPTVSYWNPTGDPRGDQHVGYINGANSDDGRAHVTRSYWNMPLPSAAPGSHVSVARFTVQNTYTESCTASPTALLWTPTVGPGTTWNNQPGANAQLDSVSFANGRSGCNTNDGLVDFNALSATAQQVAANASHITLMLKGDESNITSWKKFADDAKLQVSWTAPPATPSIIDSSCSRSAGILTSEYLRGGDGTAANPQDTRKSKSGTFSLVMQADGNLVEYKSGVGAVWSSGTGGTGNGGYAVLQPDGNFVVYKGSGVAAWSSGTSGKTAAAGGNEHLVVQDDGNLVLYENDGQVAWSSNTASVVINPAWTCYSNQTPTQKITANSTYFNGKSPYIRFFESEGGAAKPGAIIAVSTPNSPVQWSAPEPGNDDVYQFQAIACVQDPIDLFVVCSGYSQLINGVVDTVPPSTPSIAGGASGVGSKDGASGTVGQLSETVPITPPSATDEVAGYEWTVEAYTTNAQSFAPDTSPLCGTSHANFVTTCTISPTDPLSVLVNPTDEHNQLDVVAFDMAGNVSPLPAQLQFYSKANPDVVTYAHRWTTNNGSTGCSGSIADSAANGPAATLLGGICRADTTDNTGTTKTAALQPTGTPGARAATSASVIDTTQSFTVGAWLYTAVQENSSSGMTALAQEGAHESAFDLQDSGGYWGICMPLTDQTSWNGTCASMATGDSGAKPFVPRTWTFVVAEYDAANRQLRVAVGTGAGIGAWHSLPFAPNFPSSGSVWIGSGMGGSTEQPFSGAIANPFITQGLMSSTQLGQFQNPGAAAAVVGGSH